jgi:hypothetical protein
VGTGYGNTARGIVREFGQLDFDTALAKTAKVGGINDNATLDCRSGPDCWNPSFGVISGTAVDPRPIQIRPEVPVLNGQAQPYAPQ